MFATSQTSNHRSSHKLIYTEDKFNLGMTTKQSNISAAMNPEANQVELSVVLCPLSQKVGWWFSSLDVGDTSVNNLQQKGQQ